MAGIVDDEVEAVARGEQVAAEGFDTGSVAKVEAEDFQPVRPGIKIRFGGIAGCGVARKARGDDKMRAAAEEFDPGLITDFDAAASQQRDSPFQISEFSALAEV